MDSAALDPTSVDNGSTELRELVRSLDAALAHAWGSALRDGVPAGAPHPWTLDSGDLSEARNNLPGDARIAAIWREATKAAESALAGGTDAGDERSDAIRLLEALLEDPLGSRFAPAWLLSLALMTDAPLEQRVARSTAARRLAAPDGAVARWGRVAEVAAALAGSDIEEAIDRATIAVSSHRNDAGFEALLLAVRSLGGRLTADAVRRAVLGSPRIALLVSALPGGRTLAGWVAEAQGASRGQWLARCRHLMARLDDSTRISDELRSRFGSAVPVMDRARTALDSGSAAAEELAEIARSLEACVETFHEDMQAWIDAEIAAAERDRDRLIKFVGSLRTELKDRERQVAGIEHEAAQAGIALHDFGLYSPFHFKKRRRAAAYRAHYEECVTNRDQAKALIEQNERRIEVDLTRISDRIALLVEYRDQLAESWANADRDGLQRSAVDGAVL